MMIHLLEAFATDNPQVMLSISATCQSLFNKRGTDGLTTATLVSAIGSWIVPAALRREATVQAVLLFETIWCTSVVDFPPLRSDQA